MILVQFHIYSEFHIELFHSLFPHSYFPESSLFELLILFLCHELKTKRKKNTKHARIHYSLSETKIIKERLETFRIIFWSEYWLTLSVVYGCARRAYLSIK